MEAILELNYFLIKYKLGPIEKSNPYSQTEESDESSQLLDNSRKETFNFVLTLFNHFDCLYDKLKDSFNVEYLKNFLQILKNKRRDNFDYVETPFHVLLQKRYLLKGKFAKACGHYSKAVYYFTKSKERGVISDANIYRSAVKQIISIVKSYERAVIEDMNYNKECLKRSETSQFEVTKDTIKRINEIKKENETLKTYKDNFSPYLEELENELAAFKYMAKDVIVMVDFSDSMLTSNLKKIELTQKSILSIFENLITEDDKFALFTFCNHINPVVSLSYKNESNVDFIIDLIKSLDRLAQEKWESDEYLDEKYSDLKNALTKICKFIFRKSFAQRDRWVVVFTDQFYIDEKDAKEISSFLRFIEEENQLSVIVIGVGMEKKQSIRCQEFIKQATKSKSEFIDIENIYKLRNTFKITGIIREEERLFHLERYEAETRNV